MRKIILLDKNWTFYKNPDSTQGEEVSLPHTWNAVDGQDGGNDYYRGTCKYECHFSRPELEMDGKAYLEFDGAAMTADVVINGTKAVHHEGGYGAFRADITQYLKDENKLEVYVDNSDNTKVYPQKADFTFYGGLYRMVKLVTVSKNHFELDYAGGTGIKVTPEVTLTDAAAKKADAKVTVELWMVGDAEAVTVTIDGQQKETPVENGYAKAVFDLANVHLWDGVDDPYLYTAKAELSDGDIVETTFGCRSFSIDPQKGFFLNGRSYPLRGVSRHQDRAGAGNALTHEMHREDMEIIKELGANTIRLAHYQHAQEFYDLCDENGMIVWAEIPYITMHMSDGTENTLSQMRELVVQNYNHPSIVCWGLSNEITAASAVNEELLENHRKLNDLCHALDMTRPTVMADVFMLETDSPMLEIPDMNSYNLYFGWYLGELEQNDSFFDAYHTTYPDRVIGLSEYGADANPAYHSAKPERGDYTEEYQCIYHEHMAKMIEERPYLWATHVWNLFDFAADGRDEGGKHGVNQKGLVTIDRKLKKDAFYLYKAYWSKTPFVHVCGRRYVDRTEDVTEIKVYSNGQSVTLFVDGVERETAEGSKVFKFEVPITGTHKIRAVSGACEDEITVKKVEKSNPDYIFNKQGDVVNWFDRDDFKADHYSISDTLGELAQNEMANAIVQRLMAQASASRGDVAESVKDNPALQRMMQRMTLVSLLKQAGDAVSEEQMKALNDALQKIPKNQA
uniref:glycoside hydrolase family 2 protein n=1 Tax=Roseburia inulinivorans TaxID=360807 RepID=UPI00402A311B